MNILMLQSAGKNPVNSEYKKTCWKALNDIDGVTAMLYGPGYSAYDINDPRDTVLKWADVIIHMEDYNSDWIPDLYCVDRLKIYWSMDTHLKGREHIQDALDNRFSIFLTAVYDCGFKKHGIGKNKETVHEMETVWFPNCYPEHLFKAAMSGTINQDINVGFNGNIANRGDWIKKLERGVRLMHTMEVGDMMPRAHAATRVNWNRNISHDINCRTFEVLGAGGFLLTNSTPGLEVLFDVGKHLVVYESLEECLDLCRYYLRNEKERKKIAKAGLEHVRKNHSDVCRAKRLVSLIKENL